MVPPPSYLPGRSIAQFPLMMERPERLRKAGKNNETVPHVSPGHAQESERVPCPLAAGSFIHQSVSRRSTRKIRYEEDSLWQAMSSALRNLGHDHFFHPFKPFHYLDLVEKGGVGVVRREGCGNGEGKGRVRGRRGKKRKGNHVISH